MLDMRRRVYETGHTEMLTRDKKNVIARTFVVWRIGDPLTFTQAIGIGGGAEAKLDGLLRNAAIGTLGGHDLSALVSTNADEVAKFGDRLAVLRCMSTKEGDHSRGTYLMRTGYLPQGPIQYPSLGAFLSKELGDPRAELPNFISIAPERFLGAAAWSGLELRRPARRMGRYTRRSAVGDADGAANRYRRRGERAQR